MNFWEAELVGKFLRATRHESLKLYPVVVTVESPRRSDGNPLQFNVGYLIGDLICPTAGSRFSLNYMRIQNHLRKMGLARDSLKALQHAELADIEVVQPNFDESVADGRLSDEGSRCRKPCATSSSWCGRYRGRGDKGLQAPGSSSRPVQTTDDSS